MKQNANDKSEVIENKKEQKSSSKPPIGLNKMKHRAIYGNEMVILTKSNSNESISTSSKKGMIHKKSSSINFQSH